MNGIHELRRIVSAAGWSAEDAFNDLTMLEVIRLMQACLAMDLETLPDQLYLKERKYAARTGKISKATLERLYRAEYGPHFARVGRDWEKQAHG